MDVKAFIVAHPIWATVINPLIGAIVLDLVLFVKANGVDDFTGKFSLRVALFKYLQAVGSGVLGALTTAGLIAGGSAIAFTVYVVYSVLVH